MDIKTHWPEIRRVLQRAQVSTIHCSLASISPDGMPHVTPIGTVFLRDDCTGYFFDPYATGLASNLDRNPSICLMAVDAGRMFWLRSLLLGRFPRPPGVRLYGRAGVRREATADEIAAVAARVRPTRWLKGNRMLWSNFSHVRDIDFTAFRPVQYPVMMAGLWRGDA